MAASRWFLQALRLVTRSLRLIGSILFKTMVVALAAFFAVVFLGNVIFSAARDAAHRPGHPNSTACSGQTSAGWAVLATGKPANNEFAAIAQDAKWRDRLSCTIQTHSVPIASPQPGEPAQLTYHLAFLEFQEDGNPQAIGAADVSAQAGHKPIRSQLDALRQHLESRPSNYVVAFAHGWRHDASLGDGNVADLRHYAAHAARFIAERRREGRYVNTEVTAVYIGWPGARVDETWINRAFESVGLRRLGEWLTSAAAVFTLFDRKPISEQVAPYALSALRLISDDLATRRQVSPAAEQKMIVFGHSLGGNMLMTALGEQLGKHIDAHKPGAAFPSPVGDLVVLLNPASEAAKWTALQRAVWRRIAFKPFEGPMDEIRAGHRFFDIRQKPALISVTAARYWPPGGVRDEDCLTALDNPNLKRRLTTQVREEARGLQYDAPTHDLFPAFRFDFRPVAESLTRWAQRIESPGLRAACAAGPTHPVRHLLMKPVFWFADRLRYFPFINTDHEQTRTIGHLEAPRPAFGSLLAANFPERPFGTTHELAGLSRAGAELPIGYAAIGNEAKACPSAPGWLYTARKIAWPNGSQWDTASMTPEGLAKVSAPDVRRPSVQFVHGYVNTGRAPITRGNDPFWNIRAYDNALAKHNGYALSSFICAMQQLVLDDITALPPPRPPPT